MAGLERLADRELGGMEALFLKGDGEVATRSTVTSLFRFDGLLDFDDVLLAHDRGTREAVRFRQRVVVPVVPLSRPYWIVDPDFDLHFHVRRAELTDGGTARDLLDRAALIGQEPLDPARPLWDVTLITGMADGTSALLYKMHHALTDGGGGPDMFAGIFTTKPGPVDRALPPAPAVEDVTALEVTRQRAGQLPLRLIGGTASTARKTTGLAARALQSPRGSVTGAVEYVRSLRRTMAKGPAGSPLLAGRSLGRRYATIEGSAVELRAVAKRMDCSLNDIYIAVLCAGLSGYHDRMGLPVSSIPLAMPVSIRKPDDPIDSNRFVGARIEAPLAAGADIAERARQIRAAVLAVRGEPALGAFNVMAPVASMLPMWLLTSLLSVPPSDVQASNFPTWTQPRYLGRAKLLSTFNFGPLAMSALMSVMVTYCGKFNIGLNVDTAAVSDPGMLVDLIAAALDDLLSPSPIAVDS